MNQILYTKENNNSPNKEKSTKAVFKSQFFTSILLSLIIVAGYLLNLQIKNSKEHISKEIASDYNITRLYSNSKQAQGTIYQQDGQTFTVIGMIEIPKINIYYPIISESNDELLKIAPCRVSGPIPNEDGNLCIAGHNYNNYKFFSKLSNLSIDDNIVIHDINGNKASYNVYKIYQVSANDLSPLDPPINYKKEVTLITCNNFNSSNRLIIKANLKE